jgi:hypothetical protein
MRRTICFALFGLLVSNGAAFPQARAGAGPLARPRGRVIVVHSFAARPAVFFRHCVFAPFPYPVWNFIQPVPTYALEPVPTYAFAFTGSASHPQLVFKDGTTYMVTDYWRVDDQLHFITIEEGGTKSVPHTVQFADLDVQRTTDVDTAQGFRFLVRDAPIEQWLQHHGQHTPSRVQQAQ